MVMMVATFITLSISIFQDHLGRKRTIVLCVSMILIGWILIMFTNTIICKVIGLILFWSYGEIITIGSNVLSSEVLVNPFRKHSVNWYQLVLIFAGLTGHYLTHYFNSYKSFMSLLFFAYLIPVAFVWYLVPESPSFLLKIGFIDHLKQEIQRISKYNKIPENQANVISKDLNEVISSKYLLEKVIKR